PAETMLTGRIAGSPGSRVPMFGIRHRVESAGAPGMAATQPAHAQPKPLQGSMPFNRLDRINRAGGGEPAIVPDPRADEVPVKADRGNEQGLDHDVCTRSSKDSASARNCF